MRKIPFLGAGLLLALAGQQTVQHNTPPKGHTAQQVRDLATQLEPANLDVRKPVPAKPVSQPAAQRKVVAQAPPLFPALGTRFIEKPHLRKVKYGKRRWVMV
jgi:hypothetical protein